MFTATESEAIKRLLQATNAVLATPKNEPVHPEVLVELEHGRTAVATCYADYVDSFAEKLDKAKDNMHAAWVAFSPKTRNSYGPIFDAANVRPEPEPVIDAEATSVEGEVLAVDGQPVAGLLTAAPNLLTEGEPEDGKHYEEDENGNLYEVDEPFERFEPEQTAAPEDELGKRRRRKKAGEDTEAAGTVA